MNNLKTKVDDLDVAKLKTVPIDLKKLRDVVSKEVVENTKFKKLNTKINSLEKKIPDATTLIHINQSNTDEENLEKRIGDVMSHFSGLVRTTVLNTKISKVDKKIPDTSDLVTTTVLNTNIKDVENKVPDVSGLVKKTDYDAQISDMR